MNFTKLRNPALIAVLGTAAAASQAAVDAGVTSAITAAGTDGVTVAGAVGVAMVGIWAAKLIYRKFFGG